MYILYNQLIISKILILILVEVLYYFYQIKQDQFSSEVLQSNGKISLDSQGLFEIKIHYFKYMINLDKLVLENVNIVKTLYLVYFYYMMNIDICNK